MTAAEMVPGPAFMREPDVPAVQAFVNAYDVENECGGCGRLPIEGCVCTRAETPDLIGVLDRKQARDALRRVAAAANDATPVKAAA